MGLDWPVSLLTEFFRGIFVLRELSKSWRSLCLQSSWSHSPDDRGCSTAECVLCAVNKIHKSSLLVEYWGKSNAHRLTLPPCWKFFLCVASSNVLGLAACFMAAELTGHRESWLPHFTFRLQWEIVHGNYWQSGSLLQKAPFDYYLIPLNIGSIVLYKNWNGRLYLEGRIWLTCNAKLAPEKGGMSQLKRQESMKSSSAR